MGKAATSVCSLPRLRGREPAGTSHRFPSPQAPKQGGAAECVAPLCVDLTETRSGKNVVSIVQYVVIVRHVSVTSVNRIASV